MAQAYHGIKLSHPDLNLTNLKVGVCVTITIRSIVPVSLSIFRWSLIVIETYEIRQSYGEILKLRIVIVTRGEACFHYPLQVKLVVVVDSDSNGNSGTGSGYSDSESNSARDSLSDRCSTIRSSA